MKLKLILISSCLAASGAAMAQTPAQTPSSTWSQPSQSAPSASPSDTSSSSSTTLQSTPPSTDTSTPSVSSQDQTRTLGAGRATYGTPEYNQALQYQREGAAYGTAPALINGGPN